MVREALMDCYGQYLTLHCPECQIQNSSGNQNLTCLAHMIGHRPIIYIQLVLIANT